MAVDEFTRTLVLDQVATEKVGVLLGELEGVEGEDLVGLFHCDEQRVLLVAG